MSLSSNPKRKQVESKAIVASTAAASTPQAAALTGMPAVGGSTYRELSPQECYTLVPDIRNAIDISAINKAKVKPRLFSASGDEIERHPVLDLLNAPEPFCNWTQFVQRLETFFAVTGERMVWKIGGDRPQRLKILNPTYAWPNDMNVSNPEQLKHWMYSGRAGMMKENYYVQIDAKDVMFCRTVNVALYELRGISPLLTLSTIASTSHFIDEFNAAYHKNGAQIGNIILRFPRGTSQQIVDNVVAQFSTTHGIAQGNAFKVVGIAGDEIQIERTVEQKKEGHYVELNQQKIEQIYACLGVPMSMAGYHGNNTTALCQSQVTEELENAWENRVLPSILDIQDFLQTQLIDAGGWDSAGYSKRDTPKSMKGAAKRMYQQAMDSKANRRLVLMLDPDHIPVVSKLRTLQLEAAMKLSGTLGISPNESLDHFGLLDDFEKNPARDQIYIPSTLTSTEERAAYAKPMDADGDHDGSQTDDSEEEEIDEEQKQIERQWLLDYRKAIITSAASGRMYLKSELPKLPRESYKRLVAKDLLALRPVFNLTDEAKRIDAAKVILKKHTRKELKQYAR